MTSRLTVVSHEAKKVQNKSIWNKTHDLFCEYYTWENDCAILRPNYITNANIISYISRSITTFSLKLQAYTRHPVINKLTKFGSDYSILKVACLRSTHARIHFHFFWQKCQFTHCISHILSKFCYELLCLLRIIRQSIVKCFFAVKATSGASKLLPVPVYTCHYCVTKQHIYFKNHQATLPLIFKETSVNSLLRLWVTELIKKESWNQTLSVCKWSDLTWFVHWILEIKVQQN